MDRASFTVTVEARPAGYTVVVEDLNGGEYARVGAPSLDVALRMAVPYMACAAEPVSFAALQRKLAAREATGPRLRL